MTAPFAFVGGVLTARECRILKRVGVAAGWERATILRGSKVAFDKTVRDAGVARPGAARTKTTKAVVNKIISTARWVSAQAFNVSLKDPEVALVILRYRTGGKYKWHIDHGQGPAARREISVVVQLSSEKQYRGGGLLFKAQGRIYEAPKLQGTVVVFPSKKTVHALQPVSSGTRYSAVLWLSAPTRTTR